MGSPYFRTPVSLVLTGTCLPKAPLPFRSLFFSTVNSPTREE